MAYPSLLYRLLCVLFFVYVSGKPHAGTNDNDSNISKLRGGKIDDVPTTKSNHLNREQRLHRRRLQSTTTQGNTTTNDTKSRGMVLCTGSKMLPDAIYVIDQTRNVFNSTMNITLAHCGELSAQHWEAVAKSFPDVTMTDLCDPKNVDPKTGLLLGMNINQAHHRIHSWFCKTAAIILAPFTEVMVVDLDVVWFQKPDYLFDSPAFVKTGTLFFRDRVTFDKKRSSPGEHIFQDTIKELIVKEMNKNITTDIAKLKAIEGGHSFFWKNQIDEDKYPGLNNFQDSSVVLVDRSRHPKFLEVLTRLLPDFNTGYGDKEIYWLSATIAEEPFSFEPFLASLYGDCGLLAHYDPRQSAIDDPSSAQPFYLNGEWLLEKIHILGHDLEFEHPNPILVNETTELINLAAYRGCTCSTRGCRSMPYEVNQLLLRAQWERLSRMIARRGPEFDCMPIQKSTAKEVSDMLSTYFIPHQYCPRYGCSYVPITINASYLWFGDSFCDPVSFELVPPPALKDMAKQVQVPPQAPPLTEREVLRGSGRQVYLVQNGTLHAFPNGATFMKMGFDFSQVVVLPDWVFHIYSIGSDLPPL